MIAYAEIGNPRALDTRHMSVIDNRSTHLLFFICACRDAWKHC